MRDICTGVRSNEGREEDGLDDAVFLARPIANQREDLVWHVARVVPQCAGASMRPHDGRLRQSDCLPHGLNRGVGQIDHDALAVEFPDELDAELAQRVAVVGLGDRRARAGARRKSAVARVRQRQVSDAQLREDPQRAQRVAQDVRAFHADQRRDLARPERRPHLLRAARVLQVVVVQRNHVLDDVEHLECVPQVVRRVRKVLARLVPRHVVARRPHRPKRPAQSPLSHPRDVDVSRKGAVQFREAFERLAVCFGKGWIMLGGMDNSRSLVLGLQGGRGRGSYINFSRSEADRCVCRAAVSPPSAGWLGPGIHLRRF